MIKNTMSAGLKRDAECYRNIMIDEFTKLLRSTGREGMDTVIKRLEESGFFTAPASTRFHLCEKGGLVRHSLNVCHAALQVREMMRTMNPEVYEAVPEDSVIIAALLHDTCKADIYKETTTRKRNSSGAWEDVQSYDVDFSNMPLGHGEKSVIMLLSWGLKMTEAEMLAIRWHMTAWDLPFQSPELKANLSAARAKAPLCGLIQAGDCIASSLIENKGRS